MNLHPRSLRQKVIIGYLVGLLLIGGVAVLNLENLHSLERMVEAGDRAAEFFEATLEMRRFEKNFFLYGAEDDYLRLEGFLGAAEGMLGANGGELGMFAGPEVLSGLRGNMKRYRELWGVFHATKTRRGAPAWEAEVREAGKAIVTSAEEMSRAKSRLKKAFLISSRRTLSASLFFVVLTGLIIGALSYRMFVKPLVTMERHMLKVAEGEFSPIPFESADREFVSLNRAFVRMLTELDARQKRFFYQSEKLASLGTMVSGVAHQLNNPLSNISTSCQILLEELEGNDLAYRRELLEQINGQVDRAKGIVHSLLEFSRKKDFVREPLPLSGLIAETVELLRGEIPSGVEIKTDISEDIWVSADKQRLQQVFLNIIKNGLDALPDRIVISAVEASGGGSVLLSFRDTGMGIEAGDMQRLFEPFFTTKPDGKGSGLGLFVAREIIEEHNGLIEVESKPGEGTTFEVRLPIKET